jgi:predicted MFS family arabinose efflux permease
MSNELDRNPTIKFFLIMLALVISAFASMIYLLLSGLLLIDIGETFNVTVAIAGQIRTFSFIISIVFALLTSIFTLKYNHKLLLQIGLIAYCVSAIGCYLAPTFVTMVASFSLTGIGYALTTTMALTLTAELFPVEKRGEIVGWIYAGMSGSYLIGAFIVPYLQSIGGWRFTFIGYMLPSSAMALILSTIFIPRDIPISPISAQRSLKESFQNIFSNRSVFLSFVGLLLVMASGSAVNTYFSSFFREWFNMMIGEVSIIVLIASSLYTLGSIVSGKIVNRIGRKPLTVVTILFSGVMIMSFSRIPNAWISGVSLCVCMLSYGMMDTASTSLILEQLPVYAGVMMSLSRAVNQLGFSVGSGLGGLVLLLYGYQDMFLILGAFSIASAIVFQYFTIDSSTRT